MKIRRLIATIALLIGLLAGGFGGFMASVPEASADCIGNSGEQGDNNVNIGNAGGEENCDVTPAE
jgi:hypothetical protein